MKPRLRTTAALGVALVAFDATTLPPTAADPLPGAGSLIDDRPAVGSITIHFDEQSPFVHPEYSETYSALGWSCSYRPKGAPVFGEVRCISPTLPVEKFSGWGCDTMTLQAFAGETVKLEASFSCIPHDGLPATVAVGPLKGVESASAVDAPWMHGVAEVVCRFDDVDGSVGRPFTVECSTP